ncbi:CpsD/CapB family tyrosine-protein kinase [Sulfitobacter aestuariivivens]|uniref:CpsD/CapB family tyrosine-protein kinase n=1 Tax=Sulfitobacter aestuariivivens TaxID=2766981 RepID=A0A927CZS6_9RHOB|nr:CpsD/CapB family tyrosine-protein kinase [Sulfitobacter aestuariivivens]MBD3662404.1 CpsD/CapB family tyrosine-protein kinase [Sulfitobacter aestuariivivens]
MRDSYLFDDSSDQISHADVVQTGTGFRHSIRPRRAVVEQAQKRAMAQAFDTPFDSRVVADAGSSRWDDLPLADPGTRRALSSAMPVVDAGRDTPSVRAFDLLRTRLRQTTQEHGWRNIAVTAPTSGCGNTFTAVNLALSLSRIAGSRTVLMDLNLRRPGVARAFDMKAPSTMRDYLDGTIPLGDAIVRVGDTLALALNEDVHENPSETLQDPATALTLERMRASLRPELVIYDMPAMLANDDLTAFLPQLDGVLLVSDGTQTMARELVECERMLDGQVPLLGVVLNRARKDSVPSYR